MSDTASIDKTLEEIVSDPLERLRALERQTVGEIEDLREQIRQRDEVLRKVRKMINTFDPPAPPPSKNGSRSTKKDGNRYVSERRVEAILTHMRLRKAKGEKDTFTVPELRDVMEFSEPSVQAALNMLRERGAVRLVGKNDRQANLYTTIEEA